ncbi:hypothetical protein [Kitasatospora sp. LaBMicrA B282]|uniref:hypothetical protein n=1 Tax=Kitasatospora sp. LaBMicrA B282 TaxID=3420949 RepID=UPI003D12858C
MNDSFAASLFGLLLLILRVLAPLVGAVVAGTQIRRRGRSARLALAGCLVLAAAPIVSALAEVLGLGVAIRVTGALMASNVLSLVTLPFELTGLGLLLAAALSAPTPLQAPPVPPYAPDPAQGRRY